MTEPARFTILLTDDAQDDLLSISDQRTVRSIEKRIDSLDTDPMLKGKPLSGNLQSYYSTRAAGQRYRVIYQVAMDAETHAVLVVVIGIRREGHRSDAYKVAEKRLTWIRLRVWVIPPGGRRRGASGARTSNILDGRVDIYADLSTAGVWNRCSPA